MNFVAKTGRNEPCLCRSGKKYKRCCGNLPAPAAKPAAAPQWIIEDDGLDDLSNSVLDLVKARRFDHALAACKRLVVDFPDVNDGFDRYGIVHAAMGNHALAAENFRRAHDFAADPVPRADYDEELIEDWRSLAEKHDRLAAAGERASGGELERAP
jgi:tetratricopeptide (TPR) repeat protein